METSGVTPGIWISAPDLADIVLGDGPFATVQMAVDVKIENAAQRNELRWKGARDDLAAQGAPDAALSGIDALVPDAHLEGQTLIVVADTSGVRHASHWPEPPVRELARWAPLPTLGPVLRWRQASPPYVTVVADRTGADIHGVRPGRPDLEETAEGRERPIRKVQAGGWSHRRYQQRAETTWVDNAREVAEAVERMVARVNARVVVVAGEVRAMQALRNELSDHAETLLREVAGSRSDDSGPAIADDDLGRVLADVTSHDTEVLLAEMAEERGQQDRASEGVTATVNALSMGQVEVLLVHDDPEDGRMAWFGPEPVNVGTSPADLRAMGVVDPQQGRLGDVLIRAALGTGAGVRILPDAQGLADGVGAILRWS